MINDIFIDQIVHVKKAATLPHTKTPDFSTIRTELNDWNVTIIVVVIICD